MCQMCSLPTAESFLSRKTPTHSTAEKATAAAHNSRRRFIQALTLPSETSVSSAAAAKASHPARLMEAGSTSAPSTKAARAAVIIVPLYQPLRRLRYLTIYANATDIPTAMKPP